MRVLHFLDTTNRGGAETQVLDICRNALDFGLEMTFVTAQGGTLEEEFRESGAAFIRLGRKFPIDLYLASQLRRIIKERGIEVVHGYQAVEGLHLYLATRGLKNVRRVLSFQGGTVYDWKNRRTLRFLIPRMDANVVVSKGLKRLHAETDRFDTSNFVVIPNGADAKRLKPTGKSLKKELGLSGDARLIGMVGNFYAELRKDQLTVCRALPRVFDEHRNANMVFAGKIENGAEDKFADCLNFCLKNNIADRVHFLGGRSDVGDVLAALDVFVLSSRREGLPVAVSEAMLAGLPLVLSDIEPLIEVSDNGRCAEIFKTGNPDELAARLLDLLGDEDRRLALAESGRQFGIKNYSIEAHLRGLKELYERIVR
ncbi:MAG: glycosyltransferase [Acidobacteria bacterium]|nr:glycosyltransferase [Acidobacteriota bacterium]